MVLGLPLVIVLARRMWIRDSARLGGESSDISGSLEGRLMRIEQAVDAIAVEVERMSESNRFTSRLLAERLPPHRPEHALKGDKS